MGGCRWVLVRGLYLSVCLCQSVCQSVCLSCSLAARVLSLSHPARQRSLGGEYMVKDEAYQNFHSTFEEQVAQLSKESSAVNTILTKITDFIATC